MARYGKPISKVGTSAYVSNPEFTVVQKLTVDRLLRYAENYCARDSIEVSLHPIDDRGTLAIAVDGDLWRTVDRSGLEGPREQEPRKEESRGFIKRFLSRH